MRVFRDVLLMMRPQQWIKNLFVFPALVFSKHLFHYGYLARSLAAFGLFCLISGAVYIFNDLLDVEEDRHHPAKRYRPLASGRIAPPIAWAAFGLSSLAGVALSFWLGLWFGLVVAIYYVMNLGYSVYLKRVVILDVLIVSLGYVLRAVAGGVVLKVEISEWLLICTVLLALFLVLAKRRQELTLMDDRTNMLLELSLAATDAESAVRYRKSLDEYNPYFLDQMIGVTTASTLMAYILYTVSPEAVRKFGGRDLLYTTPFVIYGIFRYLYLIHQKREGENPTKTLLGDGPLLLDIALWGAAVVIVLYLNLPV